MTGNVGTNSTVALTGQLTSLLGQLGNMGVSIPGATGGGTGTAATGTTPATGTANAPLGTVTAATGSGQTANVTGNSAVRIDNLKSASGRSVTVLKTERGYQLVNAQNQLQGTGAMEVVLADNKLLRFNELGQQTRSFEQAEKQEKRIPLDYREGIAAGIANMSRLVAARQERTKELSDALATDANDNGSINQVDLQKLVQENTTTENITSLQKKIYDAVDGSIKTWLR